MQAYQRLLQYVTFDTTSDGANPNCPSTETQRELAETLAQEMRSLGVEDARVDANGYVYGSLPANCGTKAPALGWIAHMDTTSAAPGKNISPQIIKNYDGQDILLNPEKNIVLSTVQYPEIKEYAGEDLIVTDGTTLLGADDKAGVAEIMTLIEEIQTRNIPHGKLCFAFTPDEEIGRGADLFDIPGFGAEFAYTIDGGKLGEIEYENFNAASAEVRVHGISIHPGSAKNAMKNALLIAMEFDALLPNREIPAATEGYEGFHHLFHGEGCEEEACFQYIIRDHSMEKFQEKKAFFQTAADFLNAKYGSGTVEVKTEDSYYNMKEKLKPYMFLIEYAEKAMKNIGVQPICVPIRGGTDGCRLSYMGLPCPNLCTGGHNFHGRFEFISIQSMDKVVDLLKEMVILFTKEYTP